VLRIESQIPAIQKNYARRTISTFVVDNRKKIHNKKIGWTDRHRPFHSQDDPQKVRKQRKYLLIEIWSQKSLLSIKCRCRKMAELQHLCSPTRKWPYFGANHLLSGCPSANDALSLIVHFPMFRILFTIIQIH
jgi:hypothetical protein